MKKSFLLLTTICLLLVAFVKEINNAPTNSRRENFVVPDQFDFAITRQLKLNVSAQDNHGLGLKRIPLTISYKSSSDTVLLGRILTNADGIASFENIIPDFITAIMISTVYPGMASVTSVDLVAGENNVILAGKTTADFK